MATRVLKLTLAYDGTDYAGWQVQPNGLTIQEALESALFQVTTAKIRTTASGRTDAGVHALAQVVSCEVDTRLDDRVLLRALNANLPRDIRIHALATVEDDFHAIRCARSKRYRYVIDDASAPDVFTRKYAWTVPQPLDVSRMRRAAGVLVGEHDFSSFEATGSPRASSVRHVTHLSVERSWFGQSEKIVVEVQANGFLYNMVRNIVGSLYEVGKGAHDEPWLAEVLAARNRKLAGPTAPPQGLCLIAVYYDENLRG